MPAAGDRVGRRTTARVTIVDVAREAGVSISTVSRVLRDHPDVDATTRSVVRAAIERLGYRPSPIARALVTGQTRLLGLLVSDFTNPFYPQLAQSVEREAARAGYTVVIANTHDEPAEARRHLTRLLGQGLDGVIHASAGRDESVVLSLLGDPCRIVFTNRPPASEDVSYVVSDNFGGARDLTRHLLSVGHRRIGFIGGPAYARNATERLHGFRSAVEEVPGSVGFEVEGDFSRASGEAALLSWIDASPRPTAVIAINDSVAVGALEALIRRGVGIPDGMALAGFDGTELAASPIMSLTTVDQHSEELGRRSVKALLRQLSTGEFVPTHDVLPTKLLVRGSTGASVPVGGPAYRRTPVARPAAPGTSRRSRGGDGIVRGRSR